MNVISNGRPEDPAETAEWERCKAETRRDARDTLIDCITSHGVHGNAAADIADLILGPDSGLIVTFGGDAA